jgi:3'-5' exoribonuclease
MPRVPVDQLRLNMLLKRQAFLLREKNVLITRTGSPMLRVSLADRTGSIPGVYFDVPGAIAERLVPGQGVEVSGRLGEFKDQLQINIDDIRPAALANFEDYLPPPRRPLPEMMREFADLRSSVHEPDLSRLLSAIFDDPTFYRAFTQAPAAKVNHHACVGGLLEHTLNVARLTQAASVIYPEMNRDLIVTVTLLHDLGKVRAYDPLTFDMTEEGSLWTHLYMGASQVEHTIAALPGFDPELRLRVVHAILAHHGRLENGSPVLPMTLEAIVLHYADNLDGDARGHLDQLERGGGEGDLFSEYSPMHGTRLYRGQQQLSGPPPRAATATSSEGSPQKALF